MLSTAERLLPESKSEGGAGGNPVPDVVDDDLGIRRQRGKLGRIALIVEDRGLQRRPHLGENSRRDPGGEMAEKEGRTPGSPQTLRWREFLDCLDSALPQTPWGRQSDQQVIG